MGIHHGIRPKGNARSILNILRNPAVVYTLKNRFEPDAVAIRVRRSSDNEQDDFTFDEIFDGTLESWVGGGNDGFIVVWYDQSGNGNNAIQDDPARQPQIVSNGVLSSVDVSDADVYLDIPAITSEGTLITVTDSGTYRVVVNLDGGSHRIYTYHIWGIEQLIYFDRVVGNEEYEGILSALETLGFTVQANFGTDWENAFRERTEVDVFSLPDVLAENPQVTDFSRAFVSNNLTSIPENLFDNTPNVTSFRDTFSSNNISSIPENLFDNTPNVTNFRGTFSSNNISSIPENLFDNTPNVANFSRTFELNDLTTVPAGLFANNPNVANFSRTFELNDLTTVPAGLFDTQTQATNYEECFIDNDLDQTSVDNVLVSIAFSATENDLNDGIIGIDGGTNSPPGTAGNDAIAALEAKGWTVNVNT